MFTGIIACTGRVVALTPGPFGARLAVDPGSWDHDPEPGESIAVNGCCLTAVAPGPDEARLQFDVIRQTLDMTTIGRLVAGDLVNLEHAARADSLLGGHIVQGHVDGVGRVGAVVRDETQWRVRIVPPGDLMEFIVDQGSITLEGVSLTVAATGGDWFEVALIPTTLALTTLDGLEVDDLVNLESDCIARMVVHWLRRQQGRPDG